MVKLMERRRYDAALVEQGPTIIRYLAHLMRSGPSLAANEVVRDVGCEEASPITDGESTRQPSGERPQWKWRHGKAKPAHDGKSFAHTLGHQRQGSDVFG
jgi:hypothetical protein